MTVKAKVSKITNILGVQLGQILLINIFMISYEVSKGIVKFDLR